MNLLISEIIKKVNEAENLDEKVRILQEHKGRIVLRDLLIVSYDPRVKILVPNTDPPYRVSDMAAGMNAALDTFIRQFRLFIEGKGYDSLRQSKREAKFIEICESLHKDDARIFLDAFHKKLRIDGITPKHIKEIWNYDIPEELYESTVTEVPNTEDNPTSNETMMEEPKKEDVPTKKKRPSRRRKKTTTTTKEEDVNDDGDRTTEPEQE